MVRLLGLLPAGFLFAGCLQVQTNALDSASPGGAALFLMNTIPAQTEAAAVSQTPTLSLQIQPATGIYNTGQTMLLTASDVSAVICYSTTLVPTCNAAKTGCASGSQYFAPVSIPSSTYVWADSCLPGMNDSGVQTAIFTIDSTPPTTPVITMSQTYPRTLDLTWSGSTDNVTSGLNLLYQLCYSYVSNVCNSNATFVSQSGGVQTYGIQIGALPAGTIYFSVRAVDQAGNPSAPAAQSSLVVPP